MSIHLGPFKYKTKGEIWESSLFQNDTWYIFVTNKNPPGIWLNNGLCTMQFSNSSIPVDCKTNVEMDWDPYAHRKVFAGIGEVYIMDGSNPYGYDENSYIFASYKSSRTEFESIGVYENDTISVDFS